MFVYVDQEDIGNWDMESINQSYCCPVALAMSRQLGGFWSVGFATAHEGGRYLTLPREAIAFIGLTSERDKMLLKPFSFETPYKWEKK